MYIYNSVSLYASVLVNQLSKASFCWWTHSTGKMIKINKFENRFPKSRTGFGFKTENRISGFRLTSLIVIFHIYFNSAPVLVLFVSFPLKWLLHSASSVVGDPRYCKCPPVPIYSLLTPCCIFYHSVSWFCSCWSVVVFLFQLGPDDLLFPVVIFLILPRIRYCQHISDFLFFFLLCAPPFLQ